MTTTALAVGDHHPIYLRGASVVFWNSLARAIDDGIPPQQEQLAKGRAGTGKSMGYLAAMIAVAKLFPALPGRMLVIRLTRKSLTTSACRTIRKIVHPSDPMFGNASDETRQGYRIGNWTLDLGTLDNLDNYLSSEYDIVLLDEARQAALEQWELLAGRAIRNFVFFHYDIDGNKVPIDRRGIDSVSRIPFGFCLGATNPWKPKSWFNMRGGTEKRPGPLLLIQTKLEDNPGYADVQPDGTLKINQEGEAYDRNMRLTNSGHRKRRLVDGVDCSAEGLIWEHWKGEPEDIHTFDQKLPLNRAAEDLKKADTNLIRLPRDEEHFVPLDVLKALDVREFYAGVDFGDAAPGCLWVAGYTGKRELLMLCEVYARKKDPVWWRDWVVRIHKRYPITLGFCDHREDMVNLFNDAVGKPREGPGAVFVKTKKCDGSVERNNLVVGLRIQKRRIWFDVDALMHPPDPLCLEDGIPYQTVDEIVEYVHKRDDDNDQPASDKREDRPDPKCHDHGCNAVQYLSWGVEHFEPDKRLREPLTEDRKNYLKLLTTIPVEGYQEENDLAEDLADMQDEEDDFLQDERDRMFRRMASDEDDEDDDQ